MGASLARHRAGQPDPQAWGLGFAGVLCLVGILCSLANTPLRLLSALIAGAAAVAAYALPLKLNIVVAIAVAVLVQFLAREERMPPAVARARGMSGAHRPAGRWRSSSAWPASPCSRAVSSSSSTGPGRLPGWAAARAAVRARGRAGGRGRARGRDDQAANWSATWQDARLFAAPVGRAAVLLAAQRAADHRGRHGRVPAAAPRTGLVTSRRRCAS